MAHAPARVLLAENTVRGFGGSYESLFVTASNLDRTRFEPVALFFQPNHFAERLQNLGIQVVLAHSRQFWEKEGYIEKSSKLKSALPRNGLLGRLRKRAVATARAAVGGLPMAWTVYRILKREKISILHTNNSLQRDSMMILGGVLAGVPIVAHQRQLASCSSFASRLSRRVHTLVCISDAVLAHASQNGARSANRRRVYNAVDLAALRAIQPTLPPGHPRVGIVGRIMQKKGQRYFIEAAALIRDRYPETEFYVIGQATGDDRDYEQELHALAHSLGLENRLRFTGYLDQPLGLMASLDMVVHAAIEPEPFGRVIIEALALGRPVVATALGGPVEILADGISGFLVPPADSRAIADRVLEILSDPGVASRLKKGALARAEEFGVASYIRQIHEVYEAALAR